jgi:hypothetical protein
MRTKKAFLEDEKRSFARPTKREQFVERLLRIYRDSIGGDWTTRRLGFNLI